MDPNGTIRVLTPDKPLQPGEIKLTKEQAAILKSMPRSARRAALALGQSHNPRRAARLRADLLRMGARLGR